MKIIFDNIIYSLQKSGGVSVYWTELIKRFLLAKEDTCIFYECDNAHENLFRKELSLQRIYKERRFDWRILRYLPFTRKIKHKSIFFSSYYRISKSSKAINVTVVHDFTTEYYRKGLARMVHCYQKKYALLNAQGIVCISENTKRDLLKFYPIDENKVRVIYNGISKDFFRINNLTVDQIEDQRFISFKNKKLLLYVGHRSYYKNFNLAVLAVSKIADSQYHFVIVGEKLNEQEYAFLNTHLDESRYTVLFRLDNKMLNLLYNISYALLYPSAYEGFGIPLVEAMKTGLPVIAANNSSIPEVVKDAGILLSEVTPQTILEAIFSLEESNKRSDYIVKGYKQAELFSWDKAFDAYYKYFKELQEQSDLE